MTDRPTIVTCAVTGSITRPDQSRAIPVTPEQIAESAIEAARAGAAIVHVHVRDPETGAPSNNLELYRETVDRIRGSGTDVVINLTTGLGARFVPSADDPRVPAEGSSLTVPEERVRHVETLKPEICSLDLNVMWFGDGVVMNTPPMVSAMAKAIYAAGVRPELEVFDSGDIHMAHALIRDGVLEPTPLFQICLGIRFGAAATPDSLAFLRALLPDDSPWAAFGIGRQAFPMVAQSWLLGGHVRVGLEDNLYVEKGVLAESNAALVEKAVRMVRDLGGQTASPRQARELLGLTKR